MDVAAAAVLLVLGLISLGIGLYARVRNVALGGVANVLAASLLFPHNGFGVRHYVSFAVLATVVFVVFKSSLNREMWRSIRLEVLLGLAIIANIWTSELLRATIPREVQLGLLGLLAILTTAWIGLIVLRVTKEHWT